MGSGTTLKILVHVARIPVGLRRSLYNLRNLRHFRRNLKGYWRNLIPELPAKETSRSYRGLYAVSLEFYRIIGHKGCSFAPGKPDVCIHRTIGLEINFGFRI